ncbi:MAG: c-type cytochrome, partial [Telluria sp.]
MKTATILLLALALPACAPGPTRAPEQAGGAGPAAAETGGQAHQAPQPGAQATQAPLLTAQGAQAGTAQIMGLPGASAAQAGGTPSIEAGEQLARKGAGDVAACVSCHGAQGEGMAATGFPRLAGQSAYYLGKQLAAYANGARVNPVMEPIAKAMNAQQIRNVSAYYATLGASASASASAAPGAPSKAQARAAARGGDRGRTLDMAGDASKGVQACANCHGPGGSGEPPIYPYLAGQHAAYLTAAMAQWKSGARKTDMSGQMPHIGSALSAADVTALSGYYSAMPPPPPAAQRVNVPAGSALRPAVAAAAGAPGPKAPGAAGVAGTGTEQGAPLTGGTGGGGAQGTQPP